MYDDMRKYGKENFRIYVIYEGDDYKHIEKVVTYNLQPPYNIRNKTRKEPHKKVKRFEDRNEYMRHYYSTHKEYRDYMKDYNKKHICRFCFYNGETLTMWALYQRFRKAGVENAAQEAKKYLM